MEKTIKELFLEHKGKICDKWSLYLDEWDRLFSLYRYQKIRILEIGVQNGGSLEIWARYFTNAEKIVGCDIDEACEQLQFDDGRITVIIGDANSEDCKRKILQEVPIFDIIIDDASHKSSDIIQSFNHYFPHLSDGGIYIIEDLHSSYWDDFEGGLYNPFSAMAFFKRLADIINYEHWRINKSRESYLKRFEEKLGIEFDGLDLARIHSIEFINSLCIVRKSHPEKNMLGKRIIAGTDEHSTKNWKTFDGNLIQDYAIFTKDDSNLDIFNLIETSQKLMEQLANRDRSITNLEALVREKEATLNRIYNCRGWKFLLKYYRLRDFILPLGTKRRKIYEQIWNLSGIFNKQYIRESISYIREYGCVAFLRKVRKNLETLNGTAKSGDLYQMWIKKNEPSTEELHAQKKTRFQYEPKISVIVPTFNTPEKFLRDMIESVLNQTYSNWELCIAEGGSKEVHVRGVLEEYAKKDNRIKVKFLNDNKGIAGNSNEALFEATGEFIALLDHDDVLSPNALFEVVKTINENPDADFLYSDEDKISEDGKKRYEPHFKPDWAPDTMNSYNYVCHLSVIRKDIIDEIGGFRKNFEGSQDYDLFLRVSKKAKNIIHIPKVLYHWRAHPASVAKLCNVKTYAIASAKKALSEHLSNNGFQTEVNDGMIFSTYRISYKIEGTPEVSIIIPTKDKIVFLKRCLTSILERTDYQNYKILIVDNLSEKIETFKYYDEMKIDSKVSVIIYDKPFNFSSINNYAVSQVESEYILFLNNDIEVINSQWLTSMLEHAQRKEIGAVGAKLYYPDGKIQHGGVILGLGGVAGHGHRYFPKESSGYFSRLKIIQNVSAVTAACMMVRKEVFEEVGGFDENFSHAFNDVDLCLKIRQKGYLILWTPYAELYHHESKTRGYEDTPEKQERFRKEIVLFQKKWGAVLKKGDPYYNPNLTLSREDFSIRL